MKLVEYLKYYSVLLVYSSVDPIEDSLLDLIEDSPPYTVGLLSSDSNVKYYCLIIIYFQICVVNDV